MGFRLISPRHLKKAKTYEAQKVLERLKSFLDGNFEEPVRILHGFWKDQQDAISYQELREAVKVGMLDKAVYEAWSRDYSILVARKLKPLWEEAIRAGSLNQSEMSGVSYNFNIKASRVMEWVQKRGAAFVTAVSDEQKQAIQALLAKKIVENHTVDELARFIRPCIGLTKGQAKANLRYYENMVATLKKDHPRMKPESIEKKAREAAAKYAERQHRQRAMTIAQTESAFAYNWGAHEEILQAQEQGLMGKVIKRWSTSGDDQVCSICQGLEGMELGMDEGFKFRGRKLFAGQDLLPPAHPRCACAVEYIEVEPPAVTNIPEVQVDITQTDSFREYTTEEIEDIAAQTEEIISKHISTPSMWSGNMVVTDEGIKNSDGHVTFYGKMWNCDILTKHETAPSIIMHEQIHARSISHCEPIEFYQCQKIEEASVQLLTEEICKKEDIEIVASQYDEILLPLRKIGCRIQGNSNLYEFSRELLSIKPTKRMDWLSNQLYAILRQDVTATLEEYRTMSILLDTLY